MKKVVALVLSSFFCVNLYAASPVVTQNPVPSVAQDSLFSYKLVATDSDNDPLSWLVKSGTSKPSWLTLYTGVNAFSVAGDGQIAISSTSFTNIVGIVSDSSNNIYVTEVDNNIIRKIDSSGNITTFAGNSSASGSVNGSGTNATFTAPMGLAIDSNDNIYVADSGNNLIRKIDSSANVTTIAGSGVSGSANANGTSASFAAPRGVALDSSGNIYVADTGNNSIRKIDI